jgi:hypothetical protein
MRQMIPETAVEGGVQACKPSFKVLADRPDSPHMFSLRRLLPTTSITLVLVASAFGVAFAEGGRSDNANPGKGNSGSDNPGSDSSGQDNSGEQAPQSENGAPDGNSGPGSLSNPAQPVAGETVNGGNVGGQVEVRVPGSSQFVELGRGASIPVGSIVDVRDGSVRLIAAGGQSAVFTGAVFKLRQASQGKRPVTELLLLGGDFGSCGPAGPAAFAANRGSGRKAVRGLWGQGKGNFRTRGRHGAATVRGTKWYTADLCDGTLVKVKRGKVAVRDFARKRTVLVRRGERYLATPAPKPARNSARS